MVEPQAHILSGFKEITKFHKISRNFTAKVCK
nr:MAG TPA: hypothetical protein [Caudoviricetes sp.]